MVKNENIFQKQKVSVIPPLLFAGVFVTDFQKKSNIFNSLFCKQCALVSNSSVLPSEFTYMIGERIQSMAFNESDAIKTKTAPDVTKAHGHGKISVRMIKFCTNSVTHPLTLIFQNCIAAGIFATQWEKGNIVCIHKKNEKKKKVLTEAAVQWFS